MTDISTHLWYDDKASEAAELYASVFSDARIVSKTAIPGTPSGDVETVDLSIAGRRFTLLSGGPYFRFNPSISFLVACGSPEEVERIWKPLRDGGSELMPLDSYPFSARYGWLQDRYGLSWQVMDTGGSAVVEKITPTLMFTGGVCGRTEEAVRFYTSLFPESELGEVLRWTEGEGPDRPGTVKRGAFTLGSRSFAAMDSAYDHGFGFNEAVSFVVRCDTQAEIDRYWESLSAVPAAEQCGWLKDRFGLSWQIVPTAMDEMMNSKDPRRLAKVTEAFLKMKKLDIAHLERVYRS